MTAPAPQSIAVVCDLCQTDAAEDGRRLCGPCALDMFMDGEAERHMHESRYPGSMCCSNAPDCGGLCAGGAL